MSNASTVALNATQPKMEDQLAQFRTNSIREIIAASMVGTTIEFYDFYCYGVAAAIYFPAVFFPKSDPLIGTLESMLTFAIAFCSRPFGSLLFGHFGDKIGRKATLVIALLTMGTATCVIGLLPGYNQIGILSVFLLCIARMAQGIGLAGEWSGAALVATENAPQNQRALYGSFPNLGAPMGFVLSMGLNLILGIVLTPAQMAAWGWRIPFLLSAVLVVVGLYVRIRMEETPVYRLAEQENRTVKTPLRELLKYWKQVVLGTCAMSVTYTVFYMLSTWSLAYGVKTLGFNKSAYLGFLIFSMLFFAAFIVISSVIADRYGRKKVLLTASWATLFFSLFAPQLLTHNALNILVFLCVGFMIMGTLFGPSGAYLPELFPMNVRYSGAGFSYNLAAISGAAFAPAIATWLAGKFGIGAVCGYMTLMSLIALVALYLITEGKDIDYTK